MTWDSRASGPDSVAPYNASEGPRLGFLGSLEAAYEDQARNNSIEGLAWYFSKADEDQADKARKAGKDYTPLYRQLRPIGASPEMEEQMGLYGVPNEPGAFGWQAYKDIARQFADGVDTPSSEMVAQHDKHIAELNAQDPTLGLKSMSEMFDGVKKASKDAEHRANLSTTAMGAVGGFVGGAVAGLDPRTDPLNFMTLPVGGAGKTALSRIAVQGGGQGVIEAINQATGVQENRRLLGLENGPGRAAQSILGAAVGGAAIQGLGEAVGAGLRRVRPAWFNDAPGDPAPPAPVPEAPRTLGEPTRIPPEFEAAYARAFPPHTRSPLLASRYGEPRARSDMDHVATALETWDSGRPWEIAPPTNTRLPPDIQPDWRLPESVDVGTESLDSIARRVDPEVFAAYDKLAARREALRAEVDDVAAIKESTDKASASLELREQIRTMFQQLETSRGAARRRLEKRIAELEENVSDLRSFDYADNNTPAQQQAELRRQLMKADEDIRDLAPSVSRAYGFAQKKWDAYQVQKAQIDEMLRNGDAGIDGAKAPTGKILPDDMPEAAPRYIGAVPELQTPGAVKPNETLSQAVLRQNSEQAKAVDEALDVATSDLIRASKDEEETTLRMRVRGKEVTLHMDNAEITLPTEDGRGTRVVSPRQMLKELDDDKAMLQAITSCSISTVA